MASLKSFAIFDMIIDSFLVEDWKIVWEEFFIAIFCKMFL